MPALLNIHEIFMLAVSGAVCIFFSSENDSVSANAPTYYTPVSFCVCVCVVLSELYKQLLILVACVLHAVLVLVQCHYSHKGAMKSTLPF